MDTLTNAEFDCSGNDMPANTNIPYDLVILINASSYGAAPISFTYLCGDVSPTDGRNQFGKFVINYDKILLTESFESYLTQAMIHHIIHVLGFSDTSFPNFKKADGSPLPEAEVFGTMNIGGIDYDTLITPKLLAFAREYYDHPTLPGVPLENGANRGIHFEKTFMPFESMAGEGEFRSQISMFTILFLEDTGHYFVRFHLKISKFLLLLG